MSDLQVSENIVKYNIIMLELNFAFQVTLHPGDLVYIPKGWWHHVRSHDCPNIGVAIWFHVFANETEPDDGEEVFEILVYFPIITSVI